MSYLATDELQVTSTLGIAVSSTILGTSLVGRVLGHTTISVHGDKVQSRVEAALDGGEVDVKGQLVALEGEHLVAAGALHEVQAGADVLAVAVLLDEL